MRDPAVKQEFMTSELKKAQTKLGEGIGTLCASLVCVCVCAVSARVV